MMPGAGFERVRAGGAARARGAVQTRSAILRSGARKSGRAARLSWHAPSRRQPLVLLEVIGVDDFAQRGAYQYSLLRSGTQRFRSSDMTAAACVRPAAPRRCPKSRNAPPTAGSILALGEALRVAPLLDDDAIDSSHTELHPKSDSDGSAADDNDLMPFLHSQDFRSMTPMSATDAPAELDRMIRARAAKCWHRFLRIARIARAPKAASGRLPACANRWD